MYRKQIKYGQYIGSHNTTNCPKEKVFYINCGKTYKI